jgi:hypothetical protein
VRFFQQFKPTGCLDEILYLASIQAFLVLDRFRAKFLLGEDFLPRTFSPEVDPTCVQRFLMFNSFFKAENLPKFQLASLYCDSVVADDWFGVLCVRDTIWSSPLPIHCPLMVELEFQKPTSIHLVSVLNSSCQGFEPVHLNQSCLIQVSHDYVAIANRQQLWRFDIISGSLFVYFRLECRSNQLVKFRLKEEFEPINMDCSKVVNWAFRRLEPSPFPNGSLFVDSLRKTLSEAVKNHLWKSIFMQLMPDFDLGLPRLVSLVHSLLCDVTPIHEVLRVQSATAPVQRQFSVGQIVSKVGQAAFLSEFIAEFERLMNDPRRHRIWSDNLVVYIVYPNDKCSNCVVFDKELIVFGEGQQIAKIERPAPALPIGQLARSGIELAMFARNCIELAIVLKCEEMLDVVRAIARRAISDGSIVFRSRDVLSVDEIINNISTSRHATGIAIL